jgi:hypothetical protein
MPADSGRSQRSIAVQPCGGPEFGLFVLNSVSFAFVHFVWLPWNMCATRDEGWLDSLTRTYERDVFMCGTGPINTLDPRSAQSVSSRWTTLCLLHLSASPQLHRRNCGT